MTSKPEETQRKRFADVLTRRPAYAKLAASVVFLLVASAGLAQRSSAPQGPSGSNPFGLLLSLGPGLAFLVQFFQSTRPKIAKHVVVDPDAVLVDGYPIFRRPEVTLVSRTIASVDVRRGVHRAPCELTFASEEQAIAFEAALRAPRDQTSLTGELEPRWTPGRWRAFNVLVPLAGLVGTLVGMVLLGAMLGATWAIVPAGAFVALYVHATSLPRLKVGTDGVRVDTRFGVRFHGYDRITRVRGYQYPGLFHKAAIHLEVPGGTAKIGFGTEALAAQRAGALFDKLSKRLSAFRGLAEPPRLPRVEGTTVEWLQTLRGVVDGKDGAHRRLGQSSDVIHEALKNPRTLRATRAAAAFGLAGTAEGRREVSLVAGRTVEPELRAALDAAVDLDAAAFAPLVDRLGQTG